MTDRTSGAIDAVRSSSHREPSLRVARAAVAAVFFANGAGTANWLVRIPAVQANLGLSEGALGLALLGVAVGALVAMPRIGRLVARYGSRPVTRVAAIVFAVTLMLPPLAPNPLFLVLALVALGAGNGALDVAMNAQAATVERRYGRPIMSNFHALYSLGGLAGAAAGGGVASQDIGPVPHLIAVALTVGLVAAWVTRRMLPATADAAPGQASSARPRGLLLMLGIVAFCVLFGEGAMADWSAVYLRDITGAGPGLAAAGYAAFSLAMAAGRFAGDALRARLGPVRLVRVGGVLATLGLAASLWLTQPWAAIVGFGAVGAGLSIVFPILLAAAGALRGMAPGTAIATVSTFGYSGFLAGPPIIGFVAQAFTLRGGLVVVVLTSLVIAALAGTLRRATARPVSVDSPGAVDRPDLAA
jgi:predicted MFS family arabinose efflux permease